MNRVIQGMIWLGFGLGLSMSVAANGPGDVALNDAQVKKGLQAHIEFLADDYLQGRNTGSAEYEIAARYVASHFKQYGLTPAGDNGSFFQSVPFMSSTLDMNSVVMKLHGHDGKTQPLEFARQFVSLANPLSKADEVRGAVVFVGYGIVDGQLGHNDYANLDVKGKIVAFLNGRPDSFSSEQGAHVGSSSEKIRHAVDRGAVGVIALQTPAREKIFAFKKLLDYVDRPKLNWKTKDGGVFDAHPTLAGRVSLSLDGSRALFAAAGNDLQAIFDQIEADQIPLGADLNVEVTLARNSGHKTIHSSNVVGFIQGSDKSLQQQYVVYSAHLDHIGVHGDKADNIHNGALDNASGVALMLETARMMSQGQRPKRSILFVAVTGEEKGLLGSNYFVHNPPVSTEAMVANINLDMPLILYPFADIIAFGAEHSTMGEAVAVAADQYDIKLSPDPMPEQALFTRSDHYSWVKQGIPAIFLVPGLNSKDPKIDGAKLFGQFIKSHYHQSSDDIGLPIDYAAGVTFAKINMAIGLNIANAAQRPQWNKNDFFGITFARKDD